MTQPVDQEEHSECPHCLEGTLYIYYDKYNDPVLLACDTCGYEKS